MLDIKFIREHPDVVKEGCRKKQVRIDIDKILRLDEQKRKLLKNIEALRGKRNLSTRVRPLQKEITEAKEIKKQLKDLGKKFKEIEKEFNELMLRVPNLPSDSVPIGKSEKDNVVIKKAGEKTKFDFKPRNYLEIAEKLDLIDTKRAAKVSGTRFGILKKEAVLLKFALRDFASDILVKEGFVPVDPPVMIKPEMMQGMGYVERGSQEIYHLKDDNLLLVGTAEQSIGPMHAEEIFEEKNLPKRYFSFTPCFRREAGSYGRDTKGIFRVHQFDKLEMFIFCKPEKSAEEHKFLLSLEEKIMQLLEIHYQVVQICTGDLGDPAAAKHDIEVWFPSESRYRETHSTSNCTDFQARRLNIRYRDLKNKKLEFVHTLNGTAVAIGRTLIAIIENYQQKDGSIKIPKILEKYLGKSEIK